MRLADITTFEERKEVLKLDVLSPSPTATKPQYHAPFSLRARSTNNRALNFPPFAPGRRGGISAPPAARRGQDDGAVPRRRRRRRARGGSREGEVAGRVGSTMKTILYRVARQA